VARGTQSIAHVSFFHARILVSMFNSQDRPSSSSIARSALPCASPGHWRRQTTSHTTAFVARPTPRRPFLWTYGRSRAFCYACPRKPVVRCMSADWAWAATAADN
jgi:hypothetical protein